MTEKQIRRALNFRLKNVRMVVKCLEKEPKLHQNMLVDLRARVDEIENFIKWIKRKSKV